MMKQLKPLLDWIDKNSNPIALLETRQILVLRRTTIVYSLLVLLLFLMSYFMIVETEDGLPAVLLGAYAIVATLIVPAQILFNSAERWSKDKLEMLHLTRLRPIDIVLGRILSGAGLLIILGSVILPFVALTYLMPGTQIELVLYGMLFTFCVGVLVILLTLNVTWRLEQYSFATLGKIFYFGMLLQGSFGLAGLMAVLVNEVSSSELTEILKALPWVIGTCMIFAYFGFVQAINLFRHVESNRSTPLRVGYVITLLFCLFAGGQLFPIKEFLLSTAGSVYVLSVLTLPLMLENELVGRNVFVNLPTAKWKRVLLFPLMPSVGSAIVFLLLMYIPYLVIFFGFTHKIPMKVMVYVLCQLFVLNSLILPRFRDSSLTDTLGKRNLVAALYLPALTVPCLLLAFFFQDEFFLKLLGTWVFPFAYVVDEIAGGKILEGAMWMSVVLTIGSLLLNAKLIRRSYDVLVNLNHPHTLHPSQEKEADVESELA